MATRRRDVGASVRARLLNLAREKGRAFVRDLASDPDSFEGASEHLAGLLMPVTEKALRLSLKS